MANRKNPEKNEGPKAPEQKKGMAEDSPNPHGQSKVIEMPHPDQRQNTKKNVAQTTSTTGNRMNPSVTGSHEEGHKGLSSDSMFNSADPQVTGKNRTTDRPGTEGGNDRKDNKKKIS